MKTLRCEQCASTDLTRLADREYRCNHCKARFHLASEDAPAPPPRPTPAPRPTPPAKPASTLRTVAWVVACIALLVFAASLKAQRQARLRDQRRQQALQRDIARSLDSRMGNLRLNTNEITGGRPVGSGTRLSSTTAGQTDRPGDDSNVPEPTPSKPSEYGSEAVVEEKIVKAEFVDAVPLPDRIGNIYFVGIYRNTGEAAIDRPRVEVTLWSDKKEKLAVGSGYGAFNNLLPGEEVPIKILVQKAPAYASVTYKVAPERVRFGSTARPKLAIEKPKLEPAQFGGYRLSGTVRNNDAADVRFVHIVALLLGDDRHIVGMADGFAGQRDLPAGDHSPFQLQIMSTSRPPMSFRLYHFASPAKP